ncbi:MAG: CotH kinase family protein [Opitutales bacterium]|nr:CotH kinase family protein [Opitutales bacterium]MCH8540888.1 CotH kinase family protein [Opitutales bacterium]
MKLLKSKIIFLCLLLGVSMAARGYAAEGQAVRINEVMASNGQTLADEDGDYRDWIELYNQSEEAISLEGWGLSNAKNDLHRFRFPEGTTIGPGEFLLVRASAKDRFPQRMPLPLGERTMLNLAEGEAYWHFPQGMGPGRGEETKLPLQKKGFGKDDLSSSPLTFTGPERLIPEEPLLLSGDFTLSYRFRGFPEGVWSFFGPAEEAAHSFSHWGGQNLIFWEPLTVFHWDEPLAADQWYTITLVRRDNLLSVWLDDEMVGEREFETVLEIPKIGWQFEEAEGNESFAGDFKDLFFLPIALSPEEAAQWGRGDLKEWGDWHTSFRLSPSDPSLWLSDPEGRVVDRVPAKRIPRDVSLGRIEGEGKAWFYFTDPSPGRANPSSGYEEFLEPVRFSQRGGFFHEPVRLELSHPDPEVTIYYSVDGSKPHPDFLDKGTFRYKNQYVFQPGLPDGPLLEGQFQSHRYEEPLRLEDRSPEPDSLTRKSSTFHFRPYYFPREPVRKGTTVRAMAYKEGALGRSETQTYFIWPDGPAFSLPVVSITTAPKNLFEYEEGIYTAGVDFDQWREENQDIIPGWHSAGNFHRRGPVSEVPASLEIYNFQTGDFLHREIGMRIHGGWSRGFPAKNLRLYARGGYDHRGTMDFPFFPEKVYQAEGKDSSLSDRIILRRKGNFDRFRGHIVAHRVMQPVFNGMVRVANAQLFINGEYWGLTTFHDRFDRRFVSRNFGLDPDNVVITYRGGMFYSENDGLEHEVDHGWPEDIKLYHELVEFIETEDLSDPEKYSQLKEKLCLQSYFDHLVSIIFFRNSHYEHSFWRAREPENEGHGDGRWRLYVQDFDHIIFDEEHYGLPKMVELITFLSHLLESSYFVEEFLNRYADHLNSTLQPRRIQRIAEEEWNEIAPYLPEDIARWGNEEPLKTEEDLEVLKAFARQEPENAYAQAMSLFDIPGLAEVVVEVNDPAKGLVAVNSLVIDYDTLGLANPKRPYPWQGRYFQEIPVTFEAKPKEGFSFSHWDVSCSENGTYTSRENPFRVEPCSDLQVSAAFRRDAAESDSLREKTFPMTWDLFAGRDKKIPLSPFLAASLDAGNYSLESVRTSSADIVEVGSAEGEIVLKPKTPGKATVRAEVASPNDRKALSLEVLVHGAPHVLAGEPYRLEAWPANKPRGAFPDSAVFLQSDRDDPDREAPLLDLYDLGDDARRDQDQSYPYAAERRTRINGLGEEGMAFINTGRGRDLGGLAVSLDTRGVEKATVSFEAGTLRPNERAYGLRLQYRVGNEGEWTDVKVNGLPVLYRSQFVAGHQQQFERIPLPGELLGQSEIQLLWRYHHLTGQSGPRAQIRLDNIEIQAE